MAWDVTGASASRLAVAVPRGQTNMTALTGEGHARSLAADTGNVHYGDVHYDNVRHEWDVTRPTLALSCHRHQGQLVAGGVHVSTGDVHVHAQRLRRVHHVGHGHDHSGLPVLRVHVGGAA